MNPAFRSIQILLVILSISAACCTDLLAAPQANAPPKPNEFMMTNSVGDITTYATPSAARIHMLGSTSLISADYFRARFNGIKEDPKDWGFTANLGVQAQIWKNEPGMIKDFDVMVGIENRASDTDQFPGAREPRIWYKSNPFLGFSMRLSRELMLAATYTGYTSPNDFLGSSEEIALTAKYQGTEYAVEKLNPQAKVAFHVSDGKGVYTELSISPKFGPFTTHAFTVEVPVVFGGGFNDYYAAEDDTALYMSFGAVGKMPITAISTAYGNWTAFAGAFVIFRQSSIARVNPNDDAGDSVIYGTIGLNFAF